MLRVLIVLHCTPAGVTSHKHLILPPFPPTYDVKLLGRPTRRAHATPCSTALSETATAGRALGRYRSPWPSGDTLSSENEWRHRWRHSRCPSELDACLTRMRGPRRRRRRSAGWLARPVITETLVVPLARHGREDVRCILGLRSVRGIDLRPRVNGRGRRSKGTIVRGDLFVFFISLYSTLATFVRSPW